jgi:hypothetical protein
MVGQSWLKQQGGYLKKLIAGARSVRFLGGNARLADGQSLR